MNYGKAIKMLRVSRGLQQRQLAKKVGLDSSYVSLLESGKRLPSLQVVELIASKLRVPPYLILLLASEEKDLRGIDAKHAQKLGSELLYAITETFPEASP
jgi:transcriptional regulator with XRE-family HTH domain